MKSTNGFTALELVVAIALMGIMAALAMPNLSETRDYFQVSEASYGMVQTLGEIRSEAIRIKSEVLVTFTSDGMVWDLYNNGTNDGEFKFPGSVSWNGGTPASITFDGLGLLHGLSTVRTFNIKQGTHTFAFSINRNGYIKI